MAGSSKNLFRVTSRNRMRGVSLGIETDEPDALSLLANGDQHGLAVVERLRLGVEHVVGVRSRDHDVEAGMGLGQTVGQLGRSLNHQHLIIALALEVGEHGGQDGFRALDLRQASVLLGIVQLLERIRVDHRRYTQLDRACRDDETGPEELFVSLVGFDIGGDDLGRFSQTVVNVASASPTPTLRSSALREMRAILEQLECLDGVVELDLRLLESRRGRRRGP